MDITALRLELARLAALKGAMSVVWGIVGLFALFGAAFTWLAVGKAIWPDNTGMWVAPFALGQIFPTPPGREVLGWSFVPLTLGLAFACFVLAGTVLRMGRRAVAEARQA